ncbi:MAG: vWA domain-containing protein [Caldilineaceae bacterium]
MKARIWFFALLLSIFCFVTAVAQAKTIEEFYQTETAPQPQLSTEMDRDAKVFQELKVPAILAALKYDLTAGSWPKLSESERKQLLSILNDSKLKIIYTGQQSSLAHSSGGQTIDKNTIKFHQDGFYAQGAPRSSYELAKIILHELGHVHQERYNTLPRPLRTKEWFPEELETQLLPDHFTAEVIDKLTKQLAGSEPETPDTQSGNSSAQSVVILFDASGSMGDMSKIDKAKAAARNVLWKLDENTPIALIVFYDCGDIRVEQDFTTDTKLVRAKIDQIIPSGGTPLADGIAFAKKYIQDSKNGGKARLVILSDGEESCSGDPVKAAKE